MSPATSGCDRVNGFGACRCSRSLPFLGIAWSVARRTQRQVSVAHRVLLLLVPLDDIRTAYAGVLRVKLRLAKAPPLPEQVPALVEGDPDRFEPPPIVVGGSVLRLALQESVLLRDKLFDPPVNLVVVHQSSRSRTMLASSSGIQRTNLQCRGAHPRSPGDLARAGTSGRNMDEERQDHR
jgi:hypothetical protein